MCPSDASSFFSFSFLIFKSDTLDSEGDAKVPKVFGNSDKIPAQVTNIAHYVRKEGGKPRMLVLPLGELSLYGAFFSDRIYEVRAFWCHFCGLDVSRAQAGVVLAVHA